MPISFTFDQPPPDHLTQWFTKASASKPHLHIHIQATTLGLHLHTSSHPLPDLTLNLGDAQHRFLARSLSKKQPLWRALQWKNKTTTPYLFDTTAGFGQDSFIFAHMGAKVVSIEGDPLIAAILGYAVWKIKKDTPNLDWDVHHSDAKAWLQNTNQTPTHIYLDPFFHKKNSAKPKNTMQWLQYITQETQPCPEALFQQACSMPCSHVIVKRAKEAPFLNNQKPDRGSILQKASRFDCYSAQTRR